MTTDPRRCTYGKSEPFIWAVNEEQENEEEDSDNEGNFLKCTWCRRRFETETRYFDHLKLHVTQPFVRLSKIDLRKETVNDIRKPIRLKLKKLNSTERNSERRPAFTVMDSPSPDHSFSVPAQATDSPSPDHSFSVPAQVWMELVEIPNQDREKLREKLKTMEQTNLEGIKEEAADEDAAGGSPQGEERAGRNDDTTPLAGAHKATSDTESTVASPPLPIPASPTPSEMLRPRGYMAPSPPDLGDCSLENGVASGVPSPTLSTASTVLFNPSAEDGCDTGRPRSQSSNEDSNRSREDAEEDSQDPTGLPSLPRSDSGGSGTASPTVGNITVRSAAELLSPQGLINSSGSIGCGSDNSVTADTFQALQGLVSDVQTNEGLKVLSPVDMGLLNGNSGPVPAPDSTASSYSCDVCGVPAPTRQSLEIHKASSSHYRCPIGPDCPMFSSAMELASHYHANHSGGGGVPPGAQSPQVHQLQRLQQVLPGGVTLVSNRGAMYQPQQQQQHQQQNKAPNTNLRPQGLANLPPGVQVSQSPPPPLPNLPPGVQVSKRPAPPSGGGSQAPPAKQRRQSSDDQETAAAASIKLPDSITLMRPGVSITSSPVTIQKQRTNSSTNGGSDASSVANMLATRGITVVPSSGGRTNGAGASVSTRRNSSPQTSPVVTNLNSAVSITASPQRTGGNFAVPGRSGRGTNSPSSGKLTTVDLTQEMPQPLPPPPPPARPVPQPMVAPPQPSVPGPGGSLQPRVGRPSARAARVTCQVCDKMFANPDALAVHMHSHRQGAVHQQPMMGNSMRSASKLPYECNLCTAQYPSQQGLMSHKQKYHNESAEGPELVLPVIDLKQPGTLQRLAGLGIRYFLPLAQLHNQSGGMYGLPIISVDSARNPAVCNIGGIGASNLLPLGPMKNLR